MLRKRIKYMFLILAALGIAVVSSEGRMDCVQAETVQYTYDSLGRVKTAVYSDGTRMTYSYDKNGNIEGVVEDKVEISTEAPDGTTEDGNVDSDSNTSGIDKTPTFNFVPIGNDTQILRLTSLDFSVRDLNAYNQFKKRKLVIKSLKVVKKKGKFNLKIQIQKIKNLELYSELGYEIQYATNNKFKKATTIKVERNKKKTLTAKTWKVKKNKTYYVKVRAYMKTKTGKKIYTKYSKVQKKKVE